ncbi:uncharacterized protein V1518DRAFT_422728 [Limtongia smithiae]|uniref:uncharacterized protein n=1 Tax=Limtongia smithiae TaxID=1125753 RepID=UPI0034CE3517
MSTLRSSNQSGGLRKPATGHRRYLCWLCPDAFTKAEHLHRHERSHLNDRSYSCPVCSKCFGRRDVLVRHVRIHNKPSTLAERFSANPSEEPHTSIPPVLPSTLLRADDIVAESATVQPQGAPPVSLIATPSSVAPTFPGLSSYEAAAGPTTHVAAAAEATVTGAVVGAAEATDDEEFGQSSGNILEMLLNEFSGNWASMLPVLQYDNSVAATESTTRAASLHATSTHAHPEIGVISNNLGEDSNRNCPPRLATSPLKSWDSQAVQQTSKLVRDISTGLTSEIESLGLTSIFLDACLHSFFEHFIPSFPVLHRPTFVVGDCIAPLLLNIFAVGSLFLSAKDALHKGEMLWRLGHIAVATSWPTLITHAGSRDSCSGVQLVLTALLGQTYANFSENKHLRMTGQIFHGLGFYWARQSGMFDMAGQTSCDLPFLGGLSEFECNEQWRLWAAKEVLLRAILGHYMLDGQISQLSGQADCSRAVTNFICVPTSDRLFAATTCEEWAAAIENSVPEPDVAVKSFRELFVDLFSPSPVMFVSSLSRFSTSVLLEGLQSLAADINEAGGPAVGTPTREGVARALLRLLRDRLVMLPQGNTQEDVNVSVETTELLIRWHTILLNLAMPTRMLTDFLCQKCSIDQPLQASFNYGMPLTAAGFDVKKWSGDDADARRALLHAIAIQQLISQLPLGRSNAIHLPSSLFAATTIYTTFCLHGRSAAVIPAVHRWEDVWGINLSDAMAGDDFAGQDRAVALYLQGQPPAGATTTRFDLIHELNKAQMIMASATFRWGICRVMNDLIGKWTELLGGHK